MIETERLVIRLYKKEDLKDVCEYTLDDRTMYYLSESFVSKEEVETFFEKNKTIMYSVIEKESGKIIGHLSFAEFYTESYEIGWVFNPKFTNQGFAYEAAYALISYGFETLNIHRIIATAQPENTASWKLMEKLNMRREGAFKSCIRQKEEWWDEVYYAILKEEWK